MSLQLKVKIELKTELFSHHEKHFLNFHVLNGQIVNSVEPTYIIIAGSIIE